MRDITLNRKTVMEIVGFFLFITIWALIILSLLSIGQAEWLLFIGLGVITCSIVLFLMEETRGVGIIIVILGAIPLLIYFFG